MLHYAVIRFKMHVMDGDDGYVGKHNMLRIIEHSSVPLSPKQREYQKQLQNLHEQGKTHRMISHRLKNYTDMHLPAAIKNFDYETDSLGQYDDTVRSFFTLPRNFDLRFYRQWDWVPSY